MTYPLPVVSLLLGIGRDATYTAADDKVFPTIRVRGRIVAIADPLNRILGVSGPSDPRVLAAYRLAGYTPPQALMPFDSPAAQLELEAAAEPAPRRSKEKARGKAKAASKVTPLRRRKRGEDRTGAS
jgi:hypothetical protein